MTSWLKQLVYWHMWRIEYGAHIIVTSLLWQLDCSLLVIEALPYIGPTRSVSCLLLLIDIKDVTSWLVPSWLIPDLGRFWPLTSRPCDELTVNCMYSQDTIAWLYFCRRQNGINCQLRRCNHCHSSTVDPCRRVTLAARVQRTLLRHQPPPYCPPALYTWSS